jgi:hypothetical protein
MTTLARDWTATVCLAVAERIARRQGSLGQY